MPARFNNRAAVAGARGAVPGGSVEIMPIGEPLPEQERISA